MLTKRHFLRAAGFAAISMAGPARGQISSSRPPESSSALKVLKIGAGGNISGLDIAADGTKVVRTDVYGAYRWNSATSRWDQLINRYSMPSVDVHPNGQGYARGVVEIRICPNNTAHLWMLYEPTAQKAHVYKSTDNGAHWIKTNFAPVRMTSNGLPWGGPFIAIDPQNENIVYVATNSNGVFCTIDGGATWNSVPAVGIATENKAHRIAFNPKSSVSGNRKQGIAIATYGSGVWLSADGGTTWNKSVNGPITHRCMVYGSDGRLWVTSNVDRSPTNLWRHSEGAWINVAGGYSGDGVGIVVKPDDPNYMVVMTSNDFFNLSTNGGISWDWAGPSQPRSAPNIPWMAWTKTAHESVNEFAFDPTTKRLAFAGGIGYWETPVSVVPKAVIRWTEKSVGIEELVTRRIVSPWSPTSVPVLACMDRPFWRASDPEVYPSTHGPNNIQEIVDGYSIDWCAESPNLIVGLGANEGYAYSKSVDGGMTWTVHTAPGVKGYGGNIAVSTPTNWVIMSSMNAGMFYTADGGVTWNASDNGGAGTGGWHNVYWDNHHTLCADRVTAGKFYALHGNGKIYVSTDGGARFSTSYKVPTDAVTGTWTMESVPGNAGHLFLSSGVVGPPTHPKNTFRLYRSINGGQHWSDVSQGTSFVREVWAFGFGKPKNSGGYPTIFIYGWVSGVGGIWMSDDNCATWTQLSDLYPLGSLDCVRCLEGDANIYGQCYFGFAGSGFGYYKALEQRR
jgi:hypothetical protein